MSARVVWVRIGSVVLLALVIVGLDLGVPAVGEMFGWRVERIALLAAILLPMTLEMFGERASRALRTFQGFMGAAFVLGLLFSPLMLASNSKNQAPLIGFGLVMASAWAVLAGALKVAAIAFGLRFVSGDGREGDGLNPGKG